MFESSPSSLRSHFLLYYCFLEHRLDRIDDKILAVSNETSLLSQHIKFLQDQIILRDPHVNVVGCVLNNNNNVQNSDCTIPFHTFLKCGTKVYKMIINNANFLNVVSKITISRMNLTFEPHPHPFYIP